MLQKGVELRPPPPMQFATGGNKDRITFIPSAHDL